MRGTARWGSSCIPWLLAGSCEFCQLCLHSPPSPSLSSVGTLEWMWVMRSLQHEIDMLVNHIGSQWLPPLLSHTRDNPMVRSLNLVLSTGSTTLWCLEIRGLILFLVVYSSQNKNILEFCFTSSWKMANEVRILRPWGGSVQTACALTTPPTWGISPIVVSFVQIKSWCAGSL